MKINEVIAVELVLLRANTFTVPSFEEVWKVFLQAAEKYEMEYKKIPVVIIDNINQLAGKQMGLLEYLRTELQMQKELPSRLCREQAAYDSI
jgi:hypothetical protein